MSKTATFIHTRIGCILNAWIYKARTILLYVYDGFVISPMLAGCCPSKNNFWWAISSSVWMRASSCAWNYVRWSWLQPKSCWVRGRRFQCINCCTAMPYMPSCVVSKSHYVVSFKFVKRIQVDFSLQEFCTMKFSIVHCSRTFFSSAGSRFSFIIWIDIALIFSFKSSSGIMMTSAAQQFLDEVCHVRHVRAWTYVSSRCFHS